MFHQGPGPARRRTTTGALATVLVTLLVAGCGGTDVVRDQTRTAVEQPPAAKGARDTDRTPGPDGEPRGSEDWRIRRWASNHEIEAFTTHSSGLPGTRVGLKVSTTEQRYQVWAYRIGAYDGGSGLQVWGSGPVTGREQAAPVFEPVATHTVVARWERDLTVDTAGWQTGFYVFKLQTDTGWEAQVPYVVTAESAAGTVALVSPVTTWQAYNQWGGYSLYSGANGDRPSHAVSFDRPYNGATGANDYRSAAIPIIRRAERSGVPLSYFTNVDLHTDPSSLEGARGYITMGHDEYWTNTMREAVLWARDSGTNLAFLSANTMYWRVRLEDRPTGPARLMVGYRHDAHLDPLYAQGSPEATNLFREPPAPRPEHDLLGMQYECYPVDTDYVIVSPRWWGFRGTGVRLGDHVPGLVGPEADRVYPDRRLPRPLQILSHSPYSCRGVTTTTQSVYYTVRSGAGVFSAGTLRWGCAIVDACDRHLGAATSRFAGLVTDNIIRGFAEGPVGRRDPARDNVDRFDLPTINGVSAS